MMLVLNSYCKIELKYVYISLLVLYHINLVFCNENQTKLRQHAQRVSEKNYPCKIPQPRTFHIKEFLNEDEWKIIKQKKVVPPLTVLHTCKFSGCCQSDNKTCQPADKHNVTLTFGYIIKKAKNSTMMFKDVSATNHTSCKCKIAQE